MCKAHSKVTHYKTAKITSKAVDIIHIPLSTALEVINIFLLFYICHFAVGLTHCYKTAVFFTFIFSLFLLNLTYSYRPFLLHSRKIVRLAVCTVCQYHYLANYAVAQLRRKRTLLHWSNIPDLHTITTNKQFFVFSTSSFSVSLLTASP